MPTRQYNRLDTQGEFDELRRRLQVGISEYRNGKLAKGSGEKAINRAFADARKENTTAPRP